MLDKVYEGDTKCISHPLATKKKIKESPPSIVKW